MQDIKLFFLFSTIPTLIRLKNQKHLVKPDEIFGSMEFANPTSKFFLPIVQWDSLLQR
jgi:hypothetical protein